MRRGVAPRASPAPRGGSTARRKATPPGAKPQSHKLGSHSEDRHRGPSEEEGSVEEPTRDSLFIFTPPAGDGAEAAAARRELLRVAPKPSGLLARVRRAVHGFWYWQSVTAGLYMLDGWEQLVCVLSGVAIFFGVGYGLRVACLNAAAAINDALAARAALFAAK